MKLTSPAFNHMGEIPRKYTCQGEEVSPPLKIENVPADTKSLVLIMDDPDAVKPAGRVWDHWIVWNIPPETKNIREGENPGIAGRNTNGYEGYQGPCPPDAMHRYFFKLHALDTKLNLPAGASKKEVENAMQGHILAKVELIGTYEKK